VRHCGLARCEPSGEDEDPRHWKEHVGRIDARRRDEHRKTVKSIEAAVADAEAQSGVKISAVTVGIAGDHIQSFTSRGVVTITRPDNEITQEDVDRLIDDTKRVALPLDRKIIHVIPQQFIVDGQDGIYDPVGMSGVRVEANVHIITGLVTAAQNIYRCVQRAHLHVNDMVLEPLASSYAVLEDEEKEVGVALLDIGGGTTDLAVFEERTIRHTAVIGIAGKKVTDDIRKGLGILTDHAERLKIEHGFAYEPAVTDNSRSFAEHWRTRSQRDRQAPALSRHSAADGRDP